MNNGKQTEEPNQKNVFEMEKQHFAECQQIIRENIRLAEEKVEAGKKETAELHAAVSSGDVELYNQLIVSKDLLIHNENLLRKNKAALSKPYFGRVDYTEEGSEQKECLYIGKNGVSKNRTEVTVVDWRAPVSTLYYENELGKGSYYVPGMVHSNLTEKIHVDLQLKRTFDVGDGELLGYFDNDAVATDQLLVKYLSQNKDVVLGDIISTIQKEQNEIIRESPYVDIIVQGVAGSGKTTVAMHRISYILYNYENRFAPSGFCIIGSNDMLLNYITSGLPELDVHNVGQKRMDIFLRDLLEKEWKKDYKIIDVPKEDSYKSTMEFVLALETWLLKRRDEIVPCTDVTDERQGTLLSGNSIADTIRENPKYSVVQLAKLLNERLQKRIVFLLSDEEQKLHQKELKLKYKGYFHLPKEESSLIELYHSFLQEYQRNHGMEPQGLTNIKKFHVYDLAAMVLIRKRMLAKELVGEYSQVIIDEAQDFGTMVYYVLKQMLYKCRFTIMGDVSQNINYETGMNSWREMQEQVFCGVKTHFHILAKSYRNTIEISEYAGRILDKASFGAYKITPVIRHGRAVEFYPIKGKKEALAEKTVEILTGIKERGYDTAAVICRDENEADKVRSLLKMGENEQYFSKGVMVLPIQLTKGLEFDAVLLWNPSKHAYGENEAEAKLLYVAVTRALHELHVVYNEELSPLFHK
ncbi:MAG: ATP-binding domain-containing protein [Roseburia sp.]|nr:ATP-binding domain-containing protein [Roseburia sp.]